MPGPDAATPCSPWVCQVEAAVWWHRSVRSAADLPAPPLRPGPPVAVGEVGEVGEVIHYLDTPVGPYDDVLGVPRLVRDGLLPSVHVPFIAVDSEPSRRGGRELWDLPKVLGTFERAAGHTRATGAGWEVVVTARPRGPELPA